MFSCVFVAVWNSDVYDFWERNRFTYELDSGTFRLSSPNLLLTSHLAQKKNPQKKNMKMISYEAAYLNSANLKTDEHPL